MSIRVIRAVIVCITLFMNVVPELHARVCSFGLARCAKSYVEVFTAFDEHVARGSMSHDSCKASGSLRTVEGTTF
jgi:hypothetical protein